MSADAAPLTPQTSERKRKRGEKDTVKSSKKWRPNGEADGGQPPQTQGLTEPSIDGDEAADANSRHIQPKHHSRTPRRRSKLPPQTPNGNISSNTPFQVRTSSFYLPLSPIAQGTPLQSLCAEHLSPLILTYFEPLKGIVASYSNPRLSSGPGQGTSAAVEVFGDIIDEYAATYIWVTADFLILRPERGIQLEGQVTVQSESHIGLICWNLFNATVPSTRLPKDWQWMGPARLKKKGSAEPTGTNPTGYYVDAAGKKVEGLVEFRVMDFENLPTFGKDRSFISIHGTLKDSAEAEEISNEP